MAKVVLHVGTHKTGTTSLQNSSSASRADLGRCGICYDPDLGGKKSRALQHHSIASILAEPDTDEARHVLNSIAYLSLRNSNWGGISFSAPRKVLPTYN